MEFRILGPLEVVGPDGAIRLGGPRQRAVLANLVVRANQLVAVEQLIDEVWGDDPPAAAMSSLHSYVSRLRRLLGERRIEWRPPGYIFHGDAAEIDALRFETLIGQARSRLVTEPEGAAADFAEALELWRGRPLPDLAERGALVAEAARMDELRAQAAEEWLSLELSLGREDRVAARAEQLLAEDPLRERLWGTLMLSLYRSGRQADALDAYQRVRTTLADELGIDPSSELERLQLQILRQDPALVQRGLQLRGYRLLEPIGEGVFGIVHRAIQPGVGREVALKAIRPRLAHHPDFIRRFESEAQLVARLEHPRIVPLHDYWRDEYGAFLVMRWLRGGSLRDALRAGSFEVDRAMTVLGQVGEALAAAHRAGIVHRDLKPANVLLDEDGAAYLSDFGIAKDLAAATAASTADDQTAYGSGYLSPEELRGEPTTPMTDVYGLGIVAYELLTARPPWTNGDRHAPPSMAALRPELGRAVDGVLARALDPSADARYPTVAEFVADLRLALDPQSEPLRRPSVDRNPYKGLQAFSQSDATDFFGRAALVQELIGRMAEPDAAARLLVVVGPSGSGKSSVVRAGLLPALRLGALPGSDRWFIAEMLPGPQPLSELERALRSVASDAAPGLGSMLVNEPDGLGAAATAVLPNDDTELVLLIDQLEELFTLASERERARVLDLIASAVQASGSRVRVVMTLRADFYDRPLAYREFGELVGARTQVVAPLSEAELEEVITGPIQAVGAVAEAELVTRLIRDSIDRPGALPLVEHALTELYERRQDGELTLVSLESVGGVSGAIARRAEEIYAGLDLQAREAAHRLFLRLVAVADDGTLTRRRVLRAELAAIETNAESPAIDEVLEAFGRHRFLTFDHDPETRGPTVEVAHETLLDAWQRLRGWLEDARDEIRLHQRLAGMATDWQAAERDPSFLARGTQLDAFESSLATGDMAPTQIERKYLDASRAARDDELRARREQQDRERVLERRSVMRLRWLAAALATGALVAAGLAIFGLLQVQATEREARATEARGLATAALANLAIDPDLSINLAVEAVERTRRADGTVLREAQEALHSALLASRVIERLEPAEGAISDHSLAWYTLPVAGGIAVRNAWTNAELAILPASDIHSMAVSADEDRIATVDASGAITIWQLDPLDRVGEFQADSFVDDVAFSPDGSRLAAKWVEGAAIWELDGGREWPIEFSGPEGVGVALDWSRDGSLLAIAVGAAEDETIVVSGSDGSLQHVLPGYGRTTVFSPDGSLLLTTGQDDGVLWETTTWTQVRTLPHPGWVDGRGFAADGSMVVTGGDDGYARVWDTAAGAELFALPGLSGRVSPVIFDPSGERLAGWSSDAGLRWDLTPAGSRIVRSFANPHGFSFNIGVGPCGRMVTGGETGGTLWTREGEPLVDFSLEGASPVADIVVSPDCALVALAAFDGTVRIFTDAGEAVHTLRGHIGEVWGVSFSPDGTLLASAGIDGSARVWDVATGEQRTVFLEHNASIWDVAWSPAESLVVSVGDDGAREWDPLTGEQLRVLPHDNGIVEQAFSPDGSHVAAASFDGTAAVWDVASGERTLTLAGHRGAVIDVEATPDGSRWVTASGDGTVRVWDADSGAELLVLEAQPGGAARLAFLDANHFAVAGEGVIRIYTLDVGELLAIARERVTRSLTDEECRTYLQRESCAAAG